MFSSSTIGNKLHSSSWIIDARWYYATLAFFLGVVAQESIFAYDAMTNVALIALLASALLLNAIFYFFLHNARAVHALEAHVTLLNVAQICFDLLYFFIITLLTGGGVESIAHSFYFIPIIVSMVLFGFRGAVIVAFFSGLCILISVLVQYGYILQNIFVFPEPSATIEFTLAKVGILFLIYLLTGFFGTYVAKLIRSRDTLLLEKIKESETQVDRLEELTKEFDQSAKLLVRRDLDLSLANQQLMKLDQMKSEIISVAAHQLRTPLSAIKWTLRMLLDGDVGELQETQKSLLAKGFESNERMITLINDMLSVDHIESGKIKYNFVPIQFESLVKSLLEELRPLAENRKLNLILQLPESDLPKIKMDPDKMHDVIQNLVDNAIKYSKDGTSVVVTIRLLDESFVEFAVSDSGIGIPDEQKDKIFTRFFRATNAIRTQTDGSGLGLFIAKNIIQRHGGEISYDSEVNKGTTFHFTLPIVN